VPLETRYPEFDWGAEQVRGILKMLANGEAAAVNPEIRKLAQETWLRLSEKPLPHVQEPDDVPGSAPISEPASVESTRN
tara:strand:- start:64961 stop:65197 length:237 start_codon:yes stop_codon:yes gene_type:complete